MAEKTNSLLERHRLVVVIALSRFTEALAPASIVIPARDCVFVRQTFGAPIRGCRLGEGA